jgi:hypothetical protein
MALRSFTLPLIGETGDMAAKTPRLIKPERCDHKWD